VGRDIQPATHFKLVREQPQVLTKLLQRIELGMRLDFNRAGNRVRLAVPPFNDPLLNLDFGQGRQMRRVGLG
jgi:hypothetical protein